MIPELNKINRVKLNNLIKKTTSSNKKLKELLKTENTLDSSRLTDLIIDNSVNYNQKI